MKDREKMMSTVSSPPAKLMSGRAYRCWVIEPLMKVMNRTTPNPLPAFTPMMPGSARAFLEIACSMRPLTASAAPQTSVMVILGILKSKKTVITFSSAPPVMRAVRSWNVRLNVPVTRLVMTTAMSRMPRTVNLYELRILPTPLLDDIDEERQADHCDDSIDRRFIEHPCEHIGQGKDDCAEQPGIDDCIFVHIAVYHLDDMRYQKTEEYDVSDHRNGDAREHDGNDERQPFVQSAVLTEGDRHFIAEQKDIQFFCHHIQ